MTGMAAQILWKSEKMSYRQLVDKLSDRFGGKGIEVKYQNELRSRRRGKNETLRELAQDIQRLMILAYPGERSALMDNIERDMFLTALDDEKLQLKIREKESPDLETAVKFAQTFEASKMAVEMTSRDKMNLLQLHLRLSKQL